jgi:plasmid stabilization system protein ParE
MARYTVTWSPQAEQRLADLSLSASDRQAVTQASHEIETSLALDPGRFGESRFGDTRLWFVAPLAVIFEVRDTDRVVEIISVKLASPRRP